MKSLSLFSILLFCLSVTVFAQSDAVEYDWFYAYSDSGSTVYSFNIDGEARIIHENLMLLEPYGGIRVGQNMFVGNIEQQFEQLTTFVLLQPSDSKLQSVTMDRNSLLGLVGPVIQEPLLGFGAVYDIDDDLYNSAMVFNMETFEFVQLIDGSEDCGITCVYFAEDNSRISYTTVVRGAGDRPQTTIRLVDYDTARGIFSTRYSDVREGNFAPHMKATDDGSWWLITMIDIDSHITSEYLIDPVGVEHAVPDAPDRTRWTISGNDLYNYPLFCSQNCVLTRYPDIIGDALFYQSPDAHLDDHDWFPHPDNPLLLIAIRDDGILSPDAEPTSLFNEGWSWEYVPNNGNTIVAQLITEIDGTEQVDYMLIDFETLETIAVLEDVGLLELNIERNGQSFLLRDYRQGFQRSITPTGEIITPPDDIYCLDVSSDGRLICQQNQNIVLYDGNSDSITQLMDDVHLIDGIGD